MLEEIGRKIQFFIDTHKPKKSHYIDEKGIVRKGPMKFPRCMLCNKDLEKMRKDYPRRRFIKFCSEKCRKEHNRRTKIREKLGAAGIMWNTHEDKKPHFRNEMRVIFNQDRKYPEIPFKAKKGKKYHAQR